MPTLQDAQSRHGLFYNSLVDSNSDDFEALDQEFAQIQIAIAWLMQQIDSEHAQALLNFVKGFSKYLQQRGLNTDLLKYCEKALKVAEEIDVNSGWLHLLKYEAFWALGEWDNALVSAQSAIEATKNSDQKVHARAVLDLGRLQLNRGQYRSALGTLAAAEDLLINVADYDGVAAAKAEVAAYYLNRNEHKKALDLYLEVDELRRQVNPHIPSNHTLLMLGVTHRRLKEYVKAEQFLIELIQHGASQKDRGAVATGKHHLAWTYFERAAWGEAKRLGLEAKNIYEELHDPRGSSDSDEQLGLISLAEGNFPSAEMYLSRSLIVREQLGNQHGVASSLRRLAKLHLAQKHFRSGLRLLWQSIALYYHLGVLSGQRFYNIMGDLFA